MASQAEYCSTSTMREIEKEEHQPAAYSKLTVTGIEKV